MGQARQRGSLDQRIAQAQAKIEATRPEKLVCNGCGADVTIIHPVSTRGLPGVEVTLVDVDPSRAEVAAALGCKGPLAHHICGQSFRVIGGELTQRRECRSSHRLRRAIASQPHHLKTLRSRGRLDIRAGRNLNNGESLSVLRQVPKDSQECRNGRFVACKEVEVGVVKQIKTASLIDQSNVISG